MDVLREIQDMIDRLNKEITDNPPSAEPDKEHKHYQMGINFAKRQIVSDLERLRDRIRRAALRG